MALMESKDFELRLYDGTSPTPNYVVGRFEGDAPPFTVAAMAPQAEEILYTNKGLADPSMAYVSGPDTPTFGPIEQSFTWLFNAALSTYIDAWGNPLQITPWQVGGVTWLPVTSIGTRINSRNAAIACALPASAVRRAYLVNAYVKFPAPPGGGSSYTQQMLGLSPNQLSYSVDAPAIRVNIDVSIFGGLDKIADFPPGNEVTPN